MDISTAVYEDVGKILERIDEELIAGKGMKAVLCAGDRQTFARMWHLKLEDPDKYNWAVPCSGDFHYQFHVASKVHRVAHKPLTEHVTELKADREAARQEVRAARDRALEKQRVEFNV